MNVQLPARLDKAGFLAWVQGREERYELVGGRVVMMVGASRAHGRIVSNLIVILRNQLDSQKWDVIADFGLDLGQETLRYPDIVVDQVGDEGDLTTTSPVLLIEVLSPSTTNVDLNDKASQYLQLPNLHAYLVFAQNESKAWCWAKGEDGFPATPLIITRADEVIHVAALRVTIPLAAVYEGVKLR